MVIKTYPLGIYEENIYVLVDEKSRDACIVDPGGNGDILIKNIDLLNCNVKYILLTHGHFDHVEALKEVAEKYNAPIYMNKNEIDFMKNDKTVFGALPKKYEGVKVEGMFVAVIPFLITMLIHAIIIVIFPFISLVLTAGM